MSLSKALYLLLSTGLIQEHRKSSCLAEKMLIMMRSIETDKKFLKMLSAYEMGIDARKPVSGVCEQHRLISVAEETGFKLALSETPNTGFLATRPK